MKKKVRFYRDVLGFHTDWDGGNFAEFETGSGKTTLVLYSSPAPGIQFIL